MTTPQKRQLPDEGRSSDCVFNNPEKKRRIRKAGDEEQKDIDRLESEILKVESEITGEIGRYEECRKVLALGVSSIRASEEVKKMDEYVSRLKVLKEQRQAAIDRKSDHIAALAVNDKKAMLMENIRDERALRMKYYPTMTKEPSKTVEDEASERLHVFTLAEGRKNAPNCPTQCAELTEDNNRSVLYCPSCGFIYANVSCNAQNPVCSMPKFGEILDAPRRRSGGYKPPVHFAEIVRYFQGSIPSTAPPYVIETVRDYCSRYGYSAKDITPKVVRFFLRRMQQEEKNRHENALVKDPTDRLKRYTDYYRSAPEMAYRLSGIPPPYMSPMQEDRVFALFPLVIAAYKTSPRYLRKLMQKTDPKKKLPNNPNCFLIFYKECQLLGYDEFLPYIPLPKSTDNIDDNDTESWKHICAVNGWQYIPTR